MARTLLRFRLFFGEENSSIMTSDSDSQDKCQNQFILFFSNLFTHLFFTSITFYFSIMHYILLPFRTSYFVCAHIVQQLKMITKIVCDNLSKLLNLFKLDLELLSNLFVSLRCTRSSSDDADEYQHKNLKTYSKIKEILRDFHILPLAPREAIVSFLMLKKFPSFVWKYLWPYPKFIFEDTFSNVVVRGSKIVVTLPATVPVVARTDSTHEWYVLHLSACEYVQALEHAEKNIRRVENQFSE